MRTSRNAAMTLLACAALALCSCTTKGERSDLVLSSVLLATFAAATPPATGGTCACPAPGAVEIDNVKFTSVFSPCLVLENRLANNGDGKLRLNTNDMIIDDVKVSYESTTSTTLSVPQQTIAAGGYVPASGKISFGTTLVPAGVTLPADQAVRLHFYVEGHLLDGSKVKSSEYEYITIQCATSCPASDKCNY